MSRANCICQTRLSALCNLTTALDYMSLPVPSDQRAVPNDVYIVFLLSPPASHVSWQDCDVGDLCAALTGQPGPR